MWLTPEVIATPAISEATLDLPEGRSYRFRVHALAHTCDPSPWSDWKLQPTLGDSVQILEIQGTGSNNHLSAFIRLDGTTLMERDNFRGFYLRVLHRRDLRTVH